MREFVEQRQTQRFVCESPLVCSDIDGVNVYSGRSINHSKRGFAFITHAPLKFGTTLYFRTDSFAQQRFGDSSCRGMRGMGLAQVRWCHPLADKDLAIYGVGAKYIGPYP